MNCGQALSFPTTCSIEVVPRLPLISPMIYFGLDDPTTKPKASRLATCLLAVLPE
jgi:hypothetical protein